jgi:hypothetical protein
MWTLEERRECRVEEESGTFRRRKEKEASWLKVEGSV